jgi:hypothetical protein
LDLKIVVETLFKFEIFDLNDIFNLNSKKLFDLKIDI